jgi:outer membrane scaffolding protein for murein synthesis (MipA/OmpV family)
MKKTAPFAGLAALLLAAAALSGGAAWAENATATAPVEEAPGARQPLWEVGIAGAVGSVADYPASDRYRVRVVPFPYFVYRGAFLRSDENGTRVRTQVRSNVELDISGGASFATHSNDSGPRAGMPDLDYLLELGPNLKITVARPAPGTSLRLDLPLRAVFSFGNHWGYQGLVFNPNVGVYERSLFGSPWHGYAALGPEFTTARFQKYFYEVDPPYALPDRPAYDAHGGYFGTRLELGASRKLGKDFRVFGYGRIEDFSGARNDDSPLYKSHWGYTTFVGVSWSFWKSERSVEMPADSP